MVGLAELRAFSGCLLQDRRRYLRISCTLREYPVVVVTMTGLQMLTEEREWVSNVMLGSRRLLW